MQRLVARYSFGVDGYFYFWLSRLFVCGGSSARVAGPLHVFGTFCVCRGVAASGRVVWDVFDALEKDLPPEWHQPLAVPSGMVLAKQDLVNPARLQIQSITKTLEELIASRSGADASALRAIEFHISDLEATRASLYTNPNCNILGAVCASSCAWTAALVACHAASGSKAQACGEDEPAR